MAVMQDCQQLVFFSMLLGIIAGVPALTGAVLESLTHDLDNILETPLQGWRVALSTHHTSAPIAD